MVETIPPMLWGQKRLDWGQRTHVMGILNVTPDSFAGDGILRKATTEETLLERAVEQACAFVSEGATLIDVGGESTRPGFAPLDQGEELRRVIPVVQRLAAELPPEIIISIDTYKADVARQALDA